MARSASSLAWHARLAAGEAPSTLGLGEAELRLLRGFVAVVEAGGLSAAALVLGVDLSTVSRQLRELEQVLGVRLARRGREGFVLTPEGAQVYALARQALGQLQSLGQALAEVGRPPPPCLRLGLLDAVLDTGPLWPAGRRSLPQALAACVVALPGLQLQLRTLRPQEIERAVLAGELDAGLAVERPRWPAGLEAHPLYDEPSSLYVGPGHPWCAAPPPPPTAPVLAPLPGLALVTDPFFDTSPGARLLPEAARATPTRADSMEGVALLVATGCFAGFLPDHVVAAQPALAGLRPLWPAQFSYRQTMMLLCRRGKAAAPLRVLLRALQG
ncbi:LysR family transcriptional regulator [Ideonella livida]|uniref:LysR family transcriptional regulator n=1 Tax=Ideonella livida TaxID=2707176 RepID=A0A7C9PFI3_9BURK|nr:LysR family transcriptional regulator [Ideonella livida]NDY90408.1 LysR family transcriptional regulator [Ideonella livida]